jgi:phosphoenolpyruvate synthase/pyruvate phosphate dikinase
MKKDLFQKLKNYSAPFAVRSSANVEDSGQRSYAGQFKTILYVSKDSIPFFRKKQKNFSLTH